jgi:hypothetical protein
MEDTDSSPPDELEPVGIDTEEKPARRPALVINVYSWATPVVGVVMLLLGAAAGYFLRPVAAPEAKITQQPAAAPAQAQQPSGAASAPDVQSAEELMSFLAGETRHFVGSPDAPVTIIEFSDFQ